MPIERVRGSGCAPELLERSLHRRRHVPAPAPHVIHRNRAGLDGLEAFGLPRTQATKLPQARTVGQLNSEADVHDA